MGRKLERSVLNFACDLFLFYSPQVQTLLSIDAWAQGLEEAPPRAEVNQHIHGLGERDRCLGRPS